MMTEKEIADLEMIAGAAFYVANAWQKERGEPMLIGEDGADVGPLDRHMASLIHALKAFAR